MARIAPVLDDRDAVAELLGLVEVVGGQQHGLAEAAQLAHRVPRLPPRRGVEARRRLVEEDQLGVADQRQRQVQPPRLPAAQRPDPRVGLVLQPAERDDLVDVARARVQRGPVRERLAHAEEAVHAAGLQDDPDPLAQRARPRLGVQAEDRHLAAVARRGSPRGSRRSSSCPRRWARAGRTPRPGRRRSRSRARPRGPRRTCAGRAPRWRRAACSQAPMMRSRLRGCPPSAGALRLHRHRLEHHAPARGRARPRSARRAARGHRAARVHELGAGRGPDGAIDARKLARRRPPWPSTRPPRAPRAPGACACVATAAIRGAPNRPSSAGPWRRPRASRSRSSPASRRRAPPSAAPRPAPRPAARRARRRRGRRRRLDRDHRRHRRRRGVAGRCRCRWAPRAPPRPRRDPPAPAAAASASAPRRRCARRGRWLAYAVGRQRRRRCARLLGPELTRRGAGATGWRCSRRRRRPSSRARFDLHEERVRVLPAGLVLLDAAARGPGHRAAHRRRRPAGRHRARRARRRGRMRRRWPRRVTSQACTPDLPYAAAAAATVRVRAQELFEHAEGVLDTSRHRARARHARRHSAPARGAGDLRAVLRPPRRSSRVLRDVKALADALGARRDPDVQLAHLDALRRGDGRAGRPGLDVFAALLRDDQAAGNAVLAAALRGRRRAATCTARLRGARADRGGAGGGMKARRVKGLDPPAPLADELQRIVAVRARRAVRLHARRGRPGRGQGAARHAHRGQAPALHPRDRRPLFGPYADDGDQAHQGAAGPPRRDPRLRRHAAARPGARRALLAPTTSRRSSRRPPGQRGPRPGAQRRRAARAPPTAACRCWPPTCRRAASCCSALPRAYEQLGREGFRARLEWAIGRARFTRWQRRRPALLRTVPRSMTTPIHDHAHPGAHQRRPGSRRAARRRPRRRAARRPADLRQPRAVRGWTSTTACCSSPRTRRSRCSSARSSPRSSRRTSTSSS